MGYLAYLHCNPIVKDGKRAGSTRLAQYIAVKGAAPEMPNVEYGRYLIDWLLDAGTVMLGGNGFIPITWGELLAWCDLTGRRLDWWEAETLRKMSEAYATWSAKGQKPSIDPPWHSSKSRKKSASDKIKARIKGAGN